MRQFNIRAKKNTIFVSMNNETFTATADTTVMALLLERMPSKSRTTVKSYLRNRQVFVSGCMTTHFDHPVRSGEVVQICFERTKEALRHPMIRIVYEDDDLIVAEKRSGLLSIATDKEKQRTAYNILSEYLKRLDPTNKIFVVHRLDRETSGLMMFAKNEQVKFALQTRWEEIVTERRYVAVVEGIVTPDDQVVSTYLTESKALKVYATTHEHGKIATTSVKVLKISTSKKLSLLELQLSTGRKNQIRAHMEYIGHPIIGDKKYGATAPSPIDRVALHAQSLNFVHPISGEALSFSTPIPISFSKLFAR